MKVRFVRPVSRSAFLSRYFGLIAFTLTVVGFALHRIGMLSTPDFLAVSVVAFAFSLGALILVVVGLRQLWVHGSRGGKACVQTLFLIALPLGILGFLTFQHFQRPALYDVSSDIADVPQWLEEPSIDQRWLARSKVIPEGSRKAQQEAYPEFASHRYDGAIDRVYTAVRKTAKAQKLIVTHVKGMPGAEVDVAPALPLGPEPQEDDGFEFAPDELPTNVPVPSIRPQITRQASSQDAAISEAAPDDVVTLQAKMSNLILGMPYHLVIRLKEEGQTTLVDIRMVADYGANDFGLGIWMAKYFLSALDAEMQGLNDL